MQISYRLIFRRGYIAHPYWQEMEKLINIEKESGLRRARSEQNRARALSIYLQKYGLANADYESLKIQAARGFYTVADQLREEPGMLLPDGHADDEIVIPIKQIYGCLANAADEARSTIRVCSPNEIRSLLVVRHPIYTGKTKEDGIWERFVVVTAGTGAKLSNQRALRQNAYISAFEADLTIEYPDETVNPDRLRSFVAYAGREIGIGASRKLGWGRFEIR